jgi:hypothetical protein
MARSSRQFPVLHGPEFAAHGLLGDHDAELLPDPLTQIVKPPPDGGYWLLRCKASDRPDNLRHLVGFGKEDGGGIEILETVADEGCEPGHDDENNRRMEAAGVGRNVDAIHFARHLDIGEQHIEKLWPYKPQGGLITGRCLFDLKPLISEKISGYQPDKMLVLNEQDTQCPQRDVPPMKAIYLRNSSLRTATTRRPANEFAPPGTRSMLIRHQCSVCSFTKGWRLNAGGVVQAPKA